MTSELTFREEDHTYWLGDLQLPSVTTIIKATGCSPFSGAPRTAALENAARRGTFVHLMTEYYDQGRLDLDTVDPQLEPYLNGWIKFREETDFEVLTCEQRVHHPKHLYAGTLDRVGILNGEKVILDIKSGSLPNSAGLQMAAYGFALTNKLDLDGMGRIVVNLKNTGEYKVKRFEDPADAGTFLCLVRAFRWQQENM